MRVVALVRVSTEKQENEGASLDAQSRRFREIATARKWTVVAEFRGQESATKANSERAVLQDVLTCLRDQDVDGLWVYEQSRLTRGDELEVALLLREMRERKVMLYVGTESRDLTAIDQNMFFRIQNAVDEAETSRIRERMQRGRREKALQGRRTGGKSPYGYRNPPPGDPKRGTLQVVPEEAAIVRRIFREIAAGVSIRFLCRKFSAEGIPAPRSRAWGKTTIRRILDNPAYTGTAFYGIWTNAGKGKARKFDPTHPDAILTAEAHEPIVDPVAWNAARSAVHGNSNGRPGMLSGILTVNGQRTRIDSTDRRSYYRPAKRGRGAWLPVSDTNDLAWRAFRRLMRDPVALAALATSKPATGTAHAADAIEQLEANKARLAARHDRLVEMRADGELTRAEFAQKSEDARRAIKLMDARIADARKRIESAEDGVFERTLAAVGIALAAPAALPTEARRLLISTIARQVYVSAVAEATQPRGKGGRFAPAKAPKWRVESLCFDLLPDMSEATIGFGSDHKPARWVVQVVAKGRLIAPRRVRLEVE